MVTFEDVLTIKLEHLDEGGHANWVAQQKLAEIFHYECREKLGFGLMTLKSKDLFFVMGRVTAHYHKELFEGDKVILRLQIEVCGHTQLSYHFQIRIHDSVATEIFWSMPLISLVRPNGKAKVIRLPKFIIETIET